MVSALNNGNQISSVSVSRRKGFQCKLCTDLKIVLMLAIPLIFFRWASVKVISSPNTYIKTLNFWYSIGALKEKCPSWKMSVLLEGLFVTYAKTNLNSERKKRTDSDGKSLSFRLFFLENSFKVQSNERMRNFVTLKTLSEFNKTLTIRFDYVFWSR